LEDKTWENIPTEKVKLSDPAHNWQNLIRLLAKKPTILLVSWFLTEPKALPEIGHKRSFPQITIHNHL
jgi:hypothetical protein